MDVLNFISWIKNGQQVTTVDPTQTLIPLGLRDPRRDDGYRSATITAQNFINQIPTGVIDVGTGLNSTLRINSNSYATADYSGMLSGRCNFVTGAYGVVTGGFGNATSANFGVVAGGSFNSATTGFTATVGGSGNSATGFYSFVGGGFSNVSSGTASFVGAGCLNISSGLNAVIVGGECNRAIGGFNAVAGGCKNVTSGNFSFIGAGDTNNIGSSLYTNILGGLCNTILSAQAHVNIIGSCITSNRSCATFVNNLSIMNIPTSAPAQSGAVWSNGGVLTIVP